MSILQKKMQKKMKNLVVLYFFYTFALVLVEKMYKRYILLFFIFITI